MATKDTPGGRIRALRKALQLTGAQVASRAEAAGLSIDDTMLSRIENDGSKLRSANTRDALAAGLGLRWIELSDYLEGVTDLPTVVACARASEDRPVEVEVEHDTDLIAGIEDVILQVATMDDQMRDIDAARRTIRAAGLKTFEIADARSLLRDWINAARDLRREGDEPTPTAILARSSATKHPRAKAQEAQQGGAMESKAAEMAAEQQLQRPTPAAIERAKRTAAKAAGIAPHSKPGEK